LVIMAFDNRRNIDFFPISGDNISLMEIMAFNPTHCMVGGYSVDVISDNIPMAT